MHTLWQHFCNWHITFYPWLERSMWVFHNDVLFTPLNLLDELTKWTKQQVPLGVEKTKKIPKQMFLKL